MPTLQFTSSYAKVLPIIPLLQDILCTVDFVDRDDNSLILADCFTGRISETEDLTSYLVSGFHFLNAKGTRRCTIFSSPISNTFILAIGGREDFDIIHNFPKNKATYFEYSNLEYQKFAFDIRKWINNGINPDRPTIDGFVF